MFRSRKAFVCLPLLLLAGMMIVAGEIHRRYQLGPITRPREILAKRLGKQTGPGEEETVRVGRQQYVLMSPERLGVTSRDINECLIKLAERYATLTSLEKTPTLEYLQQNARWFDSDRHTEFRKALFYEELDLKERSVREFCIPLFVIDASDTRLSWTLIVAGGVFAALALLVFVWPKKRATPVVQTQSAMADVQGKDRPEEVGSTSMRHTPPRTDLDAKNRGLTAKTCTHRWSGIVAGIVLRWCRFPSATRGRHTDHCRSDLRLHYRSGFGKCWWG